MNKVITINLGGTAYQLEEAGFDALRAYLDTAAARLKGNPDRDEILSDIERAIGEKLNAQLNSYKNVVLTKEVEAVLAAMGPIEDDSAADGGATGTRPGAAAGATTGSANPAQSTDAGGSRPKRLYRVREGAMIAGVCNGIAAYVGIDPTIIRLGFVLLTLLWGAGILLYLIMAIVIPAADSAEEKAAAFGVPATAQEFIRRAREGYYEAMKSFPDRHARREWRRKFKQEMREWKRSFRHEMRENGHQWRMHWHARWAPGPGAAFALPLISLVHGALIVLWLSALISLLATGGLFGAALPAGLPVWGAVLTLLFVYGMLVWPLKAVRRAFYFGAGGGGAPWALFCLIDAFVWIAVVSALLWLLMHYLPQTRDAIHHLPTVFHDAANGIRDWWQDK